MSSSSFSSLLSKTRPKLAAIRKIFCSLFKWWKHPSRRWVRIITVIFGGVALLPFILTVVFAVINPPFSTISFWRSLDGVDIRKKWVDYENISPHLIKAVVTSEDSRFCKHYGVDWGAVGIALDEESGAVRGASTLTMQVAKNLYLWPSRSYLRKAIEVPLAYWINMIWSKKRIVEVYLNIVEWGPGVFGAEMAARYHFNKSAHKLNFYESALLAASLPNPHIRIAGKPGPRTQKVSGIIRARMMTIGPYLKCLK